MEEEIDDDDDVPDEVSHQHSKDDDNSMGEILQEGFMPEVVLMPGLREGYGVTSVLGTVQEDGVMAHAALMMMDPKRYPTRSRAKKAIRRGFVLQLRLEGSSDEASRQRLLPVTNSTVCHRADQLVLQTRLGKGVCYPDIPWDKPAFDLPVVYEDDHMGVVVKPPGIECYSKANGGYGRNTLKSALPFALKPPSAGIREVYRLPRAMHRLDRLTSGLFVVAKTRPAAAALARSFAERGIKKTYFAIVMDPEPRPVEAVEAEEAPHRKEEQRDGTADAPCFGKPAVTRWHLEKSFSSPAFHSSGSSGLCQLRFHLLRLHPETGRKHQLRIHCSQCLGMPIIGDEEYDDRSEIAMALRKQGLFLHAAGIELDHPVFTVLPQGNSEALDEAGGVVRLRLRSRLPASFEDLMAVQGSRCSEVPALLSTLFGKQVEKRSKAIDRAVAKANAEGSVHPFKHPQRLTPTGVTICSFYSYGALYHTLACIPPSFTFLDTDGD